MKGFAGYRMRIVWIGIVAAIVVGAGGRASADFVFDAVHAEDIPQSGKGESFSHDGLRLYIATGPPALSGGYGDRDIWVVERESPDAPWGEAVNLGPNVNTANMEGWPTISPDDLELYFGRDDGARWYPMRSTRDSEDDPWGPATEYTGVFPDEFSSDGLTKYTAAEWPGGYGGSDIWGTMRATTDDDWGDPVNLGPNVNDSSDQYGPSISSDGLALFFTSFGTLRDTQLHMCVRATEDDPWGPAVDVGAPVNGLWWVVSPEISPDGSTLYCNRSGGHGFTQVSIKPIVDFTGDDIVDTLDVSAMIEHWGTDHSLYDIGPMPWGDGVVDEEDLAVLYEYVDSNLAMVPTPAYREMDVVPFVELSWTPGVFADTYDVYFGTSLGEVANATRTDPLGVLVSQEQKTNSYAPVEALDLSRTYYWRVDEVNALSDTSIVKGATWIFTTESTAGPIRNIRATASSADEGAGPENTINGSGLNAAGSLHSTGQTAMWLSAADGPQPTWIQYEFDRVYPLDEMWVWNYNWTLETTFGLGFKDVTVEYSEDGISWATLGETEFLQGTSRSDYDHNTVVDFAGVAAKYVRLTVRSNWGGIAPQYGLSEVQFFYVPPASNDAMETDQ